MKTESERVVSRWTGELASAGVEGDGLDRAGGGRGRRGRRRRRRRPPPWARHPGTRATSGGKTSGPGQQLARRLRPGGHERGLQGGRERAGDAHHGVAPVLLGVGVAHPLVGDGHAARVADAAVHHDRPAVIALVEPRQLAEARGTELLDLAARRLRARPRPCRAPSCRRDRRGGRGPSRPRARAR